MKIGSQSDSSQIIRYCGQEGKAIFRVTELGLALSDEELGRVAASAVARYMYMDGSHDDRHEAIGAAIRRATEAVIGGKEK